jgi:flagellar M-ring protein FliF
MASDIPRQVAGAVRRMPAPRRLLILASTVLAIAAVVGVGLWAADPEWVVLYQDVSYGEAARMTEVLDGAAIRNRLGGDGSAVLVAREDQARARVLLAKEQLPLSGRPGFELFEQKQDWGMTDFTQRITYQRALEGELARTIGSTLGVERAEVHLTIPEPGALRRLDRPAKAAVVLRVRRGVLLPPGAVQGIVAIVANSVDRLSPENIAVTDETGRLLSGAPDDGTMGAGAGRRLELQRSVEEYLAGKAERLLAAAGGLGEPEVQVSAQINFDQVERTVESFDPDGQVLQSEGRSETEGSGDGSSDGGGGGAGAQTVINNTYQNSRRLERIVSSGAGLTKLTVAVLLDDRSLAADTTGVPRDRRLADVTALVRDAIGFDSARGDRITVTAVPFQQAAPADTTTTEPPRDLVGTLARFIRPAVGVVAILALVLLAFRGMKAIQALGASTLAQAGSAALPAEPGNIPPLGPLPDAVRLKNQVVAETSARPELMAQVVRAWMAEG